MTPLGTKKNNIQQGQRSSYWHRKRTWESDFELGRTLPWTGKFGNTIRAIVLLLVVLEFGCQLYLWIGGKYW